MQHLYGEPAFTAFQLAKIQTETGLDHLETAEVFFVDTNQALTDSDRARLGKLLQEAQSPSRRGPDFIVVPRIGTISPWSSKATEIVQVCGIQSINRVERGVAFWVSESSPELLTLVHDRMTQGVISTLEDARQLFHVAARPVARQILGEDPAGALQAANLELGLALSDDEIDYLATNYQSLGATRQTSSCSCSPRPTRSTVGTRSSTRAGPSTIKTCPRA